MVDSFDGSATLREPQVDADLQQLWPILNYTFRRLQIRSVSDLCSNLV